MVINEQGYFSLSNEKMINTYPKGVNSLPIGENILDWAIDF